MLTQVVLWTQPLAFSWYQDLATATVAFHLSSFIQNVWMNSVLSLGFFYLKIHVIFNYVVIVIFWLGCLQLIKVHVRFHFTCVDISPSF